MDCNQKSQFQKSIVVVPAKTRISIFGSFRVLTFAGVTLFNSFEIGSDEKMERKRVDG
jgi:hypothetical protein